MAFQKQVPISSKNNHAARTAHARARQEFKTYDTSAIRPKRSKAPIAALVVVLVAVVVAAVLVFQSCGKQDVDPLPASEQAVIVVTSGEGARDIADSLLEARLITDSKAFVDLVNQRGAAASLIPGSYLFHGGTSAEQILDALLAGPASTGDKLTVPEGLTRQAVADAVQAATAGRISAQSFLDATADASVYANTYPFLAGAGANSLEGFLFPKTYTISATDDASTVVAMMLSQYESETANLDWSYPESQGLNEYQAVILASIVEKEAAVGNRATVASVFYNRLASDRPYLESDATTAYEVGHDPTGEEVHANTPYSTYAHEGLPPTPICNPSLATLAAVCAPDKTDYLYFYSGEDGTYTFSTTYEDHQSAYS